MGKFQTNFVFEQLMFRNSLVHIVLFFVFFNPVMAQISITEVYYNTPYNEMINVKAQTPSTAPYYAKRHHLGEFIELYNYSDKDINLADWFISYKSFKFYLPNKMIKSGQLMVVTYQSNLPYKDFLYFFQLDHDTKYSDDQVIYQSDFMLRNKFGGVSLGQRLPNTLCERIVPNLKNNAFSWNFIDEPASNCVTDIIYNFATKPDIFYTVKSLQYNPIGTEPVYARPTPLSLPSSANIPTQNYDELVKGFYQSNYAYLTYSENIDNILNNICSINIQKSSQTPSTCGLDPTPVTICFNDDNAGDVTSVSTNCSVPTLTTTSTDFSPDVLKAISNDIVVYPNPTKISKVSIAWKGNAIGKINNIKVSDLYGNIISSSASTTNLNNPFICDLPSGVTSQYVAQITLTTNQTITKYILKTK